MTSDDTNEASATHPMLDRFAEMQCDMDAVRDFLEWLGREQCDIVDRYGASLVVTSERLAMRWAGIDESRLEAERRAMLAAQKPRRKR